MAAISDIEIVDAQIHEPVPATSLPDGVDPALRSRINVELALEAMDSVGVDVAVAVASEAFINACVTAYPARFAGVVTFSHDNADPSEPARVKTLPGVVAGRALVANYLDATLRPQFSQGAFDPLFAGAAKADLPMFVSTHGWSSVMGDVAKKYPNLKLIIDHVGVSQHPYSPPRDDPWDKLPDLLALSDYPNVFVKLCGVPLLSSQAYPYDDVWPHLETLFEAFGLDRIMWGSDYTRMEVADLPQTPRPRRRGMLYSDCVNFLLQTERLSHSDKEKIFNKSIRTILDWPKSKSACD